MRKSKKIISLLLVMLLLLATGMSSVLAEDCVIDPCEPVCTTETAWAAASVGVNPFHGSNWATYVVYNLAGPQTQTFPLYAGQDQYVGNLVVGKYGDDLHISYAVISGFMVTKAQIQVVKTYNDFGPFLKNGNPAPGRFTSYKGGGLGTIVIPIPAGAVGTVLIAAHADVSGVFN
ncbi:MAG: hypothetical protein HGA49_07995 [Eubacteriaceae bacterium]|nr:hypothetical protein [Eubacteriaceae bacterium]